VALVGSLSIFVVVQLALAFGPAGWIPSDTAALTPAARLAQSRVEALESYLSLMLVGVAAAVTILLRAMNRHPWAQPAPQPSAAATVVDPIG